MVAGGLSQLVQTAGSSVSGSVSVILVLLYGYLSRTYQLLSKEGEQNISKLSVEIFLPCLLFSEIGPLASWSNLKNYYIIIVYSLLFQAVSWVCGLIGVYVFRMPRWIVPCMVFNNATSLPLLLLDALGKTGTLSPLIIGDDTLEEALARGRVYLLINALVCNLTRFSFGPMMLASKNPNKPIPRKSFSSEHPFAIKHRASQAFAEATASTAEPLPTSYPNIAPYPNTDETSPLLLRAKEEGHRVGRITQYAWSMIEPWTNPPMLGGIAAVLAGVIPFLHKGLFAKDSFLFPFTQSVEKLGGLYTVLQMFVLGAHLRSKRGAKPKILPLLYLFVVRFGVLAVISTSVIYGMRKALGDKILMDPVLDFVMAIAPVGPPALTLAAIVEMSDADESTASSVAQTIVLSYVVTPLISLPVTGALAVVQKLYQ